MNYSKKHCVTCHANKIGGNMGPRLNYKECNRILEQKQLKAFILNPSSFRHSENAQTSKPQLKDIDEIVYYLEYGKSEAITGFEYSLLFRHNNSFSTETL
jgi:cytochrome c2